MNVWELLDSSPYLILLHTLVAAGKIFRENNLQSLTPLVSKVNKLLVSLDIGQHNAMKIFTVKWNVVSEASKGLLNDIFTELDGNSGIKKMKD